MVISFDANETKKPRSGKVTITDSGYKATLKFKQYGTDKITSVVRKGNKVTVKLNYSKASSHNIEIGESSWDESTQTSTYRTIIRDGNFKR